MKPFTPVQCLCAVLLLALWHLAGPAAAETSALWGENGEKWSAQSRLPDFSFAGYHSGQMPLPDPPVKANVRDFGAAGDGVADDTGAFIRALAAVQNGAVLVPAGRYKITDILYMRKSGVVLRGEGPEKTVLVFPKSLEQIKPNASATTTGEPTSGYSWSGGLIWVEGTQTGAALGPVQVKAARGAHVVTLAAPARVSVGQRVEILQEDPGDKSLLGHLYGGQPGDTSKITRTRISFVSRVTAVDGPRLTLERPLRTDVDPKWQARVRVFQPSVTEVGVENLTFEFPANPYRGHFKEDGFNPLTFTGVADCWARNLRFVNADSGPFLSGGTFVTAENLVYEANRPGIPGGETGHHGFTLGSDDLLRDFDFRTRFIHDISVENGAAGSVAERGRGPDLCFDNHKRYPYANLYTDIDVGAGTHMYRCGGGAALGRNAGAWTTFWNIRSARPQRWPPTNFGPDLMNFVGVTSQSAPTLNETGRWFEPISPTHLEPPNLYEAQLRRRLGGKAESTSRNIKAQDFMNTFGVNVHFNDNNYKNTQAIADALNIIGFSRVRGTCGTPADVAAWKDLAAKSAVYFPAGLKADVLVTGYLNALSITLAGQQALIPQISGLIETLEGPNEINNVYVGSGTHGPNDKSDQTANFAANDTAWAKALFEWKQHTPQLSRAKLLAPSIASGDPKDYAALPNISPYVDFGNVHFYAGNGRQPSNFGGGNFAAIYGWCQGAATPGKSLAVTECGQTTAGKPGQGGCDTTTQAKYVLNQLFDAAALGAYRVYFYQLMDDTADGDPTGNGGTESHFGLFDYRWGVKPAAQALANVKNLLADKSADFKASVPAYSVSGISSAGAAGSSLSISKSDGSTFIVVWNEPQIWDPKANAPVTPPVNKVTVDFGGDFAYRVYDPLAGLNATASGRGRSVGVNVLGSPIMIQVSPK